MLRAGLLCNLHVLPSTPGIRPACPSTIIRQALKGLRCTQSHAERSFRINTLATSGSSCVSGVAPAKLWPALPAQHSASLAVYHLAYPASASEHELLACS